MTSPKADIAPTLEQLRQRYPDISFTAGKTFHWSPKDQTVFYVAASGDRNMWSLLHETAHAALSHAAYTTDVELLHMEIAAWQEARQIGSSLNIKIDEDHIQDCLDTYRNWLFARATCPRCLATSFQDILGYYICLNCKTSWQVSRSRFCRIYRTTVPTGVQQKTSP